jgi:hypothetical protein
MLQRDTIAVTYSKDPLFSWILGSLLFSFEWIVESLVLVPFVTSVNSKRICNVAVWYYCCYNSNLQCSIFNLLVISNLVTLFAVCAWHNVDDLLSLFFFSVFLWDSCRWWMCLGADYCLNELTAPWLIFCQHRMFLTDSRAPHMCCCWGLNCKIPVP